MAINDTIKQNAPQGIDVEGATNVISQVVDSAAKVAIANTSNLTTNTNKNLQAYMDFGYVGGTSYNTPNMQEHINTLINISNDVELNSRLMINELKKQEINDNINMALEIGDERRKTLEHKLNMEVDKVKNELNRNYLELDKEILRQNVYEFEQQLALDYEKLAYEKLSYERTAAQEYSTRSTNVNPIVQTASNPMTNTYFERAYSEYVNELYSEVEEEVAEKNRLGKFVGKIIDPLNDRLIIATKPGRGLRKTLVTKLKNEELEEERR